MQHVIHIDIPSNSLVQNINLNIVGWFASNKLNTCKLSFKINNIVQYANLSARPDVEKALNHGVFCNIQATGWHVQVDPDLIYKEKGRTVILHIFYNNHLVYEKIFYKSASLRVENDSSPLVFMHIPKTAGTALRLYVDFAFSEWPILYIYNDYPGVKLSELNDLSPQFLANREVIFGHYAFNFDESLTKAAKYFVVVRKSQDLINSYINYTTNYDFNLLDNPLVRYISGAYGKVAYGELTEAHLDQALENINSHFYVIYIDKLQTFADEMSALLGLKKLHIPLINEKKYNKNTVYLPYSPLWHLDEKLYEYAIRREQNLKKFLCG